MTIPSYEAYAERLTDIMGSINHTKGGYHLVLAQIAATAGIHAEIVGHLFLRTETPSPEFCAVASVSAQTIQQMQGLVNALANGLGIATDPDSDFAKDVAAIIKSSIIHS